MVRQIGETQKATREVEGRINDRFDEFRPGTGYRFCSVRDAVQCRTAIETERVGPPEHRIHNFSRGRVNLTGLPETSEIVSLNVEQASFHCCFAAQSQQHAG